MKLSLMVLNAGKASGQLIPINLAQFIIGRDPQCNLRPASALISKRHCAILVRNGKVFLRDFESTNGTFLNEKPVKGEVPIRNEDLLRCGPLQFKVVLQAVEDPAETAPQASKPTPPPPSASTTDTAGDDESVAAMLLSLQEEGDDSIESSTRGDESGIPAGSTVMDMVPPPLTPEEEPATAGKKPATPAPAGKKPDEKPADKAGDARMAAKAILEKYSRRQRG